MQMLKCDHLVYGVQFTEEFNPFQKESLIVKILKENNVRARYCYTQGPLVRCSSQSGHIKIFLPLSLFLTLHCLP